MVIVTTEVGVEASGLSIHPIACSGEDVCILAEYEDE